MSNSSKPKELIQNDDKWTVNSENIIKWPETLVKKVWRDQRVFKGEAYRNSLDLRSPQSLFLVQRSRSFNLYLLIFGLKIVTPILRALDIEEIYHHTPAVFLVVAEDDAAHSVLAGSVLLCYLASVYCRPSMSQHHLCKLLWGISPRSVRTSCFKSDIELGVILIKMVTQVM